MVSGGVLKILPEIGEAQPTKNGYWVTKRCDDDDTYQPGIMGISTS